MAFADLLINRCTIQRFDITGTDGYGNPTGSWDDHLTNQACRLMAGIGGGMTGPGREIVVGAEVVIADYKLFIQDVDITEQDRVIVDEVTYEVLMVALRQDAMGKHHKACYMRTVR